MIEGAKKQLSSLFVSAAVFLLCILAIIFFSDPYKTTWLVFVLLYACIAACSLSVFTALLYLARGRRDEMLHYERMRIAVREAFLITVFILGSLILSAQQLLFWWVEAFLLMTLVLIEIFFLV